LTPAKFGDFLKQVFHRGDLGDASSMDGSLGKYIITVVTVNISGVPCTVIVSGYFTGQWSARILVWKRGLSQHDHLRPISLCPVANTMRRNHSAGTVWKVARQTAAVWGTVVPITPNTLQ